MRPAFSRAALAGVLAFAVCAVSARAQTGDRLDVAATWSLNVQRLHSIAADTLGLSYHSSYSPSVHMDFRAIDLPMGKGAAKPALHFDATVTSDAEVLGPALMGMDPGVFPLLDFGTGVALQLPLETLIKGNSGVDLRIGWQGSYVLSRTGGQNFLERSKLRVDVLRTSGALQGSSFGFGKGRDETFGYDASMKRWDVHVSLQGRVFTAPMSAPPPPPVAAKPGGKPAAPVARVVNDTRLLWIFADADVDTDGGPGADGLRGRIGVGVDLNAFTTALFAPLR